MPQLAIKYLNSGGVIVNYHCSSRCGHCLYNCGPHRSKDYLGPEMAERIFRRIAELGCRSVHIGGGEPILDPEKLSMVLIAARNVGVGIDYVETNSAWFIDSKQAVKVLEFLYDTGLRTLLVSISPFHNAHIPYKKVNGVIDACRNIGMSVFPWVNTFVRDISRLGNDKPHSMTEFESAYGPYYMEGIPDRYWIHMGGRALTTFRSVYQQYPVSYILEKSPISCAGFLEDTSHFHIDLYGNYIPGLCSGLAIDMEDLGRTLNTKKYPLIDRLATDGIRGLYDLASQTCGYSPQQADYLNHCDLCTDIRRYLLSLDDEQFNELVPVGFYTD